MRSASASLKATAARVRAAPPGVVTSLYPVNQYVLKGIPHHKTPKSLCGVTTRRRRWWGGLTVHTIRRVGEASRTSGALVRQGVGRHILIQHATHDVGPDDDSSHPGFDISPLLQPPPPSPHPPSLPHGFTQQVSLASNERERERAKVYICVCGTCATETSTHTLRQPDILYRETCLSLSCSLHAWDPLLNKQLSK